MINLNGKNLYNDRGSIPLNESSNLNTSVWVYLNEQYRLLCVYYLICTCNIFCVCVCLYTDSILQ